MSYTEKIKNLEEQLDEIKIVEKTKLDESKSTFDKQILLCKKKKNSRDEKIKNSFSNKRKMLLEKISILRSEIITGVGETILDDPVLNKMDLETIKERLLGIANEHHNK